MTQLELLKEIETLAHKLRTYVNEPILVTADAKHRYIENKIREAFGFKGTPLKFIIRERNEDK